MKINIYLIALALALDAFGVSMGIGCGTYPSTEDKLKIIFSFGFFQFLFAFLGALLGYFINQNFFRISDFLSGSIILILGILFFYEGFKDDEDCIYKNLTLITTAVLGISVSIDALGAGFSLFYNLSTVIMLQKTVIIGIVASAVTAAAFKLVEFVKHISLIERYADFIGGTILIIMGLNMIVR
ncbi:MAG: manganese efflux pump MntP family protein [Bacillota bacterium]